MSASSGSITLCSSAVRHRPPATLWIGLGIILVSEIFLFTDVVQRGWLIVGRGVATDQLPMPTTTLAWTARWFASNMTPICWVGYLLVADGILTWLARRRDPVGRASRPPLEGGRDARPTFVASIRARPNRFITAWLTSIPVWCFFDWVNFYYMDAWRYHGLPPGFAYRLVGYFIAFAAISPGVFLAAQIYLTLMRPGQDGAATLVAMSDAPRSDPLAWWLTLTPWAVTSVVVLVLLVFHRGPLGTPMGIAGSALLLLGPTTAALARRRSLLLVAFAVGVSFVAWTFIARDPLSNLTLWIGLIFLLDPINAALFPDAPSLLRDWQAGRWRRSLALAAGGLTCGLLWEFWNYWALAKWTYHLPFLGPLEHIRYFEMPLPGMLGFIPFAGECWVMLNTIIAVLEKLNLRVAEPLPDVHSVM